MAESEIAKTNVFQFMVVRAPNTVDAKATQRSYIKDDDDLFSADSRSQIGPMIYRLVFCEPVSMITVAAGKPAVPSADGIVAALVETMPLLESACPYPAVAGLLEALRDRTYIPAAGGFRVLPDRLEYLHAPLIALLVRTIEILHAPPLKEADALDAKALVAELVSVFDGEAMAKVVFDANGRHTRAFADAKRELFDTLYLLYILRRRVSVNLEYIIEGLRALHVLDAIAVEPTSISDLDTLRIYRDATPVIHPLFARLHRFKEPFNMLRPIGIGDLKVVKQWLCGYKAGDFAHVENVLDGETKTRVHRRLEKTEELFASSAEKQEETQRDTQSTDRFELKREAESVIKQDLAVNANAGVTYTYPGGMIVANITAGMAYTRSQTDQNKAADNFSREVLDKAVKRIQSRATEQRSTTKLFETEETNTHTLSAAAGKGHISGIYRWLDKEYRAQLFNYGKRMMFEFILPEPAAFFVEARLRAYEGQLDVPRPPQAVDTKFVSLDFTADKIDLAKFNELRLHYDLAEFSYPVMDKVVAFKNDTNGQSFFDGGNPLSKFWVPKTFHCDLQSKGYDVTAIEIEGTMDFSGSSATPPTDPQLRKLFAISLNGTQVFYGNYDTLDFHAFHTPNHQMQDLGLNATFKPYKLTTDMVDLIIGVQNVVHFNLEISARLHFSAEALAEWQQKAYEKVYKTKQERQDKLDAAAAQAYQAQLATYHNRLGELRTTGINELLQGQSDAFNQQLICKELKRLCLASLTKDFDSDPREDLTTRIEAMGSRRMRFEYRQLTVKELPSAITPTEVAVQFDHLHKNIQYPAPVLAAAAAKARYIQFLEQAFDWQQMAYAFYPYFWATAPKWIDLMSRNDAADPNMSAFLQAGSCKVLLAVSSAYDDAVLHYLATGEPWEGGPSPVIGDPLYVPLYEELRRQQDDLDGAEPEGKPWNFTVPTSLVYLENSSTPLPPSVCK